MTSQKYPTVSFIIPILNEEKTIKHCLDSLFSLNYPKEKIEILLAVGPSIDNTKEIIEKIKQKSTNIKLLQNPTGNTAIGRNICIEHSTGQLLMNYSGHAIAEKNLLQVLVTKLLESYKDIVAVGCSNVSPTKQTYVAKMADIVFSSFLGGKNLFVQNAQFDEERYVDHISFCLYRKNVVETVGNFDPEFWCGQDAELDLRLLKAGYKILYTPKTKVFHYKRSTVRSLFRQMYRYGIARAMMIQKHSKTLKPVHLIAPFLIVCIISIIILLLMHLIPPVFILMLITIYFLLSCISSMYITKNPLFILSSMFFYFIVHFGYGVGFLSGFIFGKL